jgi:DNA-binding NtrC family response regulator
MRPKDAIQERRTLPVLAPRAQRGRALLVNEDLDALRRYCNILQGWGYQVRAYSSYEEGVCCLGSEEFDFIMVSQGSRNFEGRCVLERAIEVNRRTPVLVIARCLDMACYLEAMQLGAADYLAEPVAALEMDRVLKNHRKTLNSAGNVEADFRRAPAFDGAA